MRTPNLLIRSRRLIASSVIVIVVGIVTMPWDARAASPAPSPAATAGTRDPALIAFLQKHFKIPNPDLIKLGPVSETPIKGIYARPLTVSNDKGQSISTILFSDKAETKGIIGTYIDMSGEPWGRMSMSQIHLDDRPTLGPADAPVTIVEFADFECPYCAHAFSVLETIASTNYKGKIKVVYKNYPLNVHPWAMKAAAAAECARLQNPEAFWQFARYFYTNQGSITAQNVQDHVDKIVGSQKLDDASLKACMDSKQTAERIQQDQIDGALVKVSSTPTFLINGIPVVGLPDNKIVDFVIDSELAAKTSAGK
ncbi:MAG: thioredoxin domain-containing protein [Candidatus Binatus sp.]|uniref:DsbA family protein n=1 Tax=Candidatus Binatus sp. TaxID=2811406 RepID=UPI0027204FF1|nr:thioredoxin domain-containing protein [Candidatus Binatus sp.]MDO8433195.1 thioredoxin domain-containing protein [Candidatus Binatus sp.]